MSPQTPPKNWKELVPPIPGFTHQPSILPRLPLPQLRASLERVKDSIHPFASSAEEFVSICKKIDDFKRSGGPGSILQQILLQRKNEKDNWLQEWWEDCNYFSYRNSLAITTSPYGVFQPQPEHLPQMPAARAAGLTYAAMLIRQKLHSGKLVPEKSKGFELCMDAYRWAFDSCRIPGIEGTDWIVSYSGTSHPYDALGHVIVIRKNRFWKIKAQVWNTVIGMGDLISQFQYIYDHTLDEHPAIGALTAQGRDAWAKDYALLSSVSRNADILREIHSSAFVLSLDDSTPPPETDADMSKALWHGTLPLPTNPTGISRGLSSRYSDKPVQFIVFDNGVAGMVAEHSAIDGTHCFRICNEILEFLVNPESDFRLFPSSSVATPEPLDFDLTSVPEIHNAIARSQQFVREIASSKALSSIKITSYGKAAIKGFGMSPDGWVQMAIQVAYARLAERFGGENGPVAPWPACTLESSSTRRFYKGRLGIIRVVSDECVAFVRAIFGNTATRDEKLCLMRDAVKKHQQLASAAARGEDVDRHLFGLIYAKPPSMKEPELFGDPLFKRSSDRILFVSNLGSSPHIRSFAWCEANSEFAIACMTNDDHLQFMITSDRRLPNAEFADEIGKALVEIYELFAGSCGLSSPDVSGQSKGAIINAKL